MKKHAFNLLAALLSFLPFLTIAQVELKPSEIKGLEPYQAAIDYMIYGEVQEVTTAHFNDLFGEVSLSTTERLKFNKKGLKIEEFTQYSGFLDMSFLIKYKYDNQDRLSEMTYMEEDNHNVVDQKISFKYDSSDRVIEKIDEYNGKTKKILFEYDEQDYHDYIIKEFNYEGELTTNTYIDMDEFGLDIKSKKTVNLSDGSVNENFYSTDILFGTITQDILKNSGGTSTTEYIYDDFTFLIEKKTGSSSTHYEYEFDAKNWIVMAEKNSSGRVTGYYKRKIEYFDGTITGDVSKGINMSSASSNNYKTNTQINTSDLAQWQVYEDETYNLKVGDIHIAKECKTAWFDDHLIAYHENSGATYILKDYKTASIKQWKNAELISSSSDAVWYKRPDGKFNVIEKGLYWDNIPNVWSDADLLVRDQNDIIKYKLVNFKNVTYNKVYPAESYTSNASGNSDCLYGDCYTGYGERVSKKDKSKYEGFHKNGSAQGPGFMVYDNQDQATAEFDQGIKNGFGAYEWVDGSLYLGYFNNDQLHGYGVYYSGDDVTPAIFKNGQYDVTYDYYSTGNSTGCIVGDCNSGFGTFKYDNGDRYTGYFLNGKLDKFGFYEFSSGGTYIGEWLNGLKHGFGVYEWDTDSSYIGYWSSDQLHGIGVYYYKDNGVYKKMSGTFKNGEHQTTSVSFD